MKIIHMERQPLVICLQETMCSSDDEAKLQGFATFHRKRRGGRRASGGVLIAVKAGIDCQILDVNSELEVIAVKVGPPLSVSIINVYLPPGLTIADTEIVALINQVPAPLLFVGDINAHHPLWGSESISARGKSVETAVNECSLTILNNGDATHVHHANGSTSCIDIACSTNDLAGILDFEVLSDTHGSDHMPLLISFPESSTNQHQVGRKWKIEKADWQLYQNTVQFERLPNAEDQIEHITKEILKAAEVAISRTKGGPPGKVPVPWWNSDVEEAVRTRRKALRELKSGNKKYSD